MRYYFLCCLFVISESKLVFKSKPAVEPYRSAKSYKFNEEFFKVPRQILQPTSGNALETSLDSGGPLAISNFWTLCQAVFFKKYRYLSLLTMDPGFLRSEDVFTVFGAVQWHSSPATYTTNPAVIIEVNSASQMQQLMYARRRSKLWHQQSIIVVLVVHCSKEVRLHMPTLWELFKLYKYVIVCGVHRPKFFIYRPFPPDKISKVVEVKKVSEILDNIKHAVDDLQGSKVRIVFFPRIPTAVAHDGQYVGGVDYSVMDTLQEWMNFTPVVFRPTDGRTFSDSGKIATGAIRDIAIGNADIALNGHFMKDYNNSKIILTRFMYMDKICFAVAMPGFKSHFAILTHIFSSSVWKSLVVVYFVINALYYYIHKAVKRRGRSYKVEELFLLTFGLFIFGGSTLRIDTLSKKILIGSTILAVLILNNTFQGALVNVLSRQIRYPYIDSVEDALNAKLGLQSQRAETLLGDWESSLLLNIFRLNHPGDKNFIRLVRLPVAKVTLYRNYLHFKPNRTEALHVIPECVMTSSLSYVVPRTSPYLARINTYLQRIQEIGLTAKWFGTEMDHALKDTFLPLTNETVITTRAKTFSMSDLSFVYESLLLGLALSSLVFLVELIVGKKKRRKQAPVLCRPPILPYIN